MLSALIKTKRAVVDNFYDICETAVYVAIETAVYVAIYCFTRLICYTNILLHFVQVVKAT